MKAASYDKLRILNGHACESYDEWANKKQIIENRAQITEIRRRII